MRNLRDTVLPSTETLLVSGGDTRIMLDQATGRSVYGCGPYPDPDLVALGSSTASTISEAGLAAANALRQTCLEQLQHQSSTAVYTLHAEHLRSELLTLCGFSQADGVNAVLTASGTDLHLLAAQWLRPHRTVMVAPTETGSGMPAAVQGQHFNRLTACGGNVMPGAPVNDWRGELVTLSVRAPDGSLRASTRVDADCTAYVDEAAEAGQKVLLILTDVSKTGLTVPSIETVLDLKRRWPAQVEVLVDACQFRLSATTVRAYITKDCMVAITGSKFMSGPTFCGALFVPSATATRYRDQVLPAGAAAYSGRADWPTAWQASSSLLETTNFGLLLRWAAAMPVLRAFFAVPDHLVTDFLRCFTATIHKRLAHERCIEALPVAELCRRVLGNVESWDSAQTIFPFLFYAPDGKAGRRPLRRDETERLYQLLCTSGPDSSTRRFQLGQPVPCGHLADVPVSALRLCVSAPMLVAACTTSMGAQTVLAYTLAALDRITQMLATWDANVPSK